MLGFVPYFAVTAFGGVLGVSFPVMRGGEFAEWMQSGNLAVMATATPQAAEIGSWLVVMGFLIGIGVGVKNLLSKKPTHAELATKEELTNYVRHSQFNEFKQEVRGDMREIKALIGGAVSKVEDFAEKSYQARKVIHHQVNSIDKALTKCETRQNEQEKQILRNQHHG